MLPFAQYMKSPQPAIDLEGKIYYAGYQCPWCQEWVRSQIGELEGSRGDGGSDLTLWGLVKCPNRAACGRVALVEFFRYPEHDDVGTRVYRFRGEAVYPNAEASYKEAGVPPQIAKEFQEALRCRVHGFFLGAALVARRALQSAVRHAGAKVDTLEREIDSLPPETLALQVRDAAHQVRLIGADAAHPDDSGKIENVTDADVDALLAYTREVLHYLFVMPDRLSISEAKRKPKPRPT